MESLGVTYKLNQILESLAVAPGRSLMEIERDLDHRLQSLSGQLKELCPITMNLNEWESGVVPLKDYTLNETDTLKITLTYELVKTKIPIKVTRTWTSVPEFREYLAEINKIFYNDIVPAIKVGTSHKKITKILDRAYKDHGLPFVINGCSFNLEKPSAVIAPSLNMCPDFNNGTLKRDGKFEAGETYCITLYVPDSANNVSLVQDPRAIGLFTNSELYNESQLRNLKSIGSRRLWKFLNTKAQQVYSYRLFIENASKIFSHVGKGMRSKRDRGNTNIVPHIDHALTTLIKCGFVRALMPRRLESKVTILNLGWTVHLPKDQSIPIVLI